MSVKFCQYVASLYLHIYTNFGQFSLIFNKMVLIVLGKYCIMFWSSYFFDSHCIYR